MVKYDFIHFFLMNSIGYNTETQKLVCETTNAYKHLFVYRFKENFKQVENKENTIWDEKIENVESLEEYLQMGKYIVIHALEYSDEKIIRIPLNVAGRLCWCIWGHDVYNRESRYDNIFYKGLRYLYHSFNGKNKLYIKADQVKSKFNCIGVSFDGDLYELRRRFGNVIPIYKISYPAGYYLSDIQKWVDDIAKISDIHKTVRVMIGHSASNVLKHMKWLKKLKRYDRDIEIYMPLSYGVKEYADQIEKIARAMYTEKQLHIFREGMSSEAYFKMLAEIDVAIFDFDRQSALGNIGLLFYLDKKVYLSPTGILYRGYQEAGLQVYSTKEIDNADLDKFSEHIPSKVNQEYIRDGLKKESVKKKWEQFFYHIINSEKNI